MKKVLSVVLMIWAVSIPVSAQEIYICADRVFTMEHEETPYIARYSFEVKVTNNSFETQCVGQDIYWWKYTIPSKPDSVELSNNWYWEWESEIVLAGPEFPGLSGRYGQCISPGETIRVILYPFRPTMDRLWNEKHQEYATEKDMLLHFFQEAVLHLYHNGETYISTCERTIHYCPEHLECD